MTSTIEDRIKWIYDKNRPTQALTDLSSLVKLSARLTTLSLSGCESVSDLGPLQTLTGLNSALPVLVQVGVGPGAAANANRVEHASPGLVRVRYVGPGATTDGDSG